MHHTMMSRTNEKSATGQYQEEWVEIVRVCTLKIVQCNGRITAWGLWKDLKTGLGGSVASGFSTNDQNTSIRHHHGGRIPSATLNKY
jgi:hypothetical protein